MPTNRLLYLHRPSSSFTDDSIRSRLQGISSVYFLKLIEDEGKVGFWTKDFAAETGTCSAGVYRILSVSMDARIQHIDLLDMMHPDDRKLQDEFDMCLRHGQPMDIDFRVIRPDGSIRWVNDRAEVLFDTDGRPARAVGILRDVTEFREAKQSILRARHRQYAAMNLFDATELGFDHAGRLLFQSGWTELTGQKAGEAMGLGWLDMLSVQSRDTVKSAFIDAAASQAAFAVHADIVSPAGGYQGCDLKAAPVRERDGIVNEWVGAVIRSRPPDRRENSIDMDRVCGSHIRAARGWLDWTREELAEASGVSISSLRRLELREHGAVRQSTIKAIIAVLEKHGVFFSQGEHGVLSLQFDAVTPVNV